jgi:hypothetical protein
MATNNDQNWEFFAFMVLERSIQCTQIAATDVVSDQVSLISTLTIYSVSKKSTRGFEKLCIM